MELDLSKITLTRGHHADIRETSEGCVMDVAAWANGDAQITDISPCVCPSIRPLAIWLNDYLEDGERRILLPYVARLAGSATEDVSELVRRARLAADLAATTAERAAERAAGYAKYAAKRAVEYAKRAVEYAKRAAEYAKRAVEYAKRAAEYAKGAVEYAEYAKRTAKYAKGAVEYAEYAEHRQQIIMAVLGFLDAASPPAL